MSTEKAPHEHGGHDVHANGMDIHYVEAGAGEPLVALENGMISISPFSARPQAPALTLTRQILGGSPEATHADPDAVAESIFLGPIVELTRADYDLR